ncbi:MAG: HEAT repeat domain-containing protein, partial [Opitutaceae bacterium]
LAAALESPAGVTRDLAQQLLIRRGDRTIAPRLEQIAVSSPLPAARGQALWTLHGLGGLQPETIRRALADPHPGVRQQALRLSEGFAGKDAALGAAVAARATDPDARVRQQAAYTLGEWPGPEAGAALAALLRADTDRYLRAAAMSSALPHADTLLEKLAGGGAEFESLIAEIATATDNARAIAGLLARITAAATATDPRPVFVSLGALLDRLQRNNQTLAQLSTKGGEPMRRALEGTDAILARARATAVDPKAAPADRTAAIALLGRGRKGQDEDFNRLAELLSAGQSAEVQLAAVRSIGRLNRTATPERLLAGWSGYGPAVRTAVLDLVLARPAWAHVLLDRAEADEVFRAQIDPGRRTVLSQHPQPKLANRAATIFGTGQDAGRQKVIDRYLAALPGLKTDAKRGAGVFANACSACHRFGETPGRPVGPDLAAVKDRSADYLVTHILDPNRAVEDRYQFYTATLQDGRTPAGLVTGETGGSLTLLGLDGTEQVILRGELRSLMSSGRSLMPEGLEAAVDEQAMADLVTFLAAGR